MHKELATMNAACIRDLETDSAAADVELLEANAKSANYQNRLSVQREVIEEYGNTKAAKVGTLYAKVCAFFCVYINFSYFT